MTRAKRYGGYTVAAEFLRAWRNQMAHQFRQEEEVLLPVFVRYRPADDPVIVTVLVQHGEIARRVVKLSAPKKLSGAVAVAHGLGPMPGRIRQRRIMASRSRGNNVCNNSDTR